MRKKPIYQIPCKFCSKILNLKEWQIKRVKNNFCNGICTMRWRYANGLDGKLITAQAHQKIRDFGQPKKKGKPASWLSSINAQLVKNKISQAKLKSNWMKGKRGKLNPNWKGGLHYTIWKSPEYQQWRKAVFERDNYTCQDCGDNKGGNLEADHIKPRYLYPELTFIVVNGRTLCNICHKKTDTYGEKVKQLVRE